MALEHVQQFALGDFNAGDQVLFNFAGALALLFGQGLQGAAQIVGHAEKIAGEIRGGIKGGLGLFALGALPQIFHFGRQAQQAVLEGGGLLFQHDDFFVARVSVNLLHGRFHFNVIKIRQISFVGHS